MTGMKLYLLLLSLFSSSFLFSQVRFSSDFESGSMGEVKLIDSVWIKTSPMDSMLTLSYEVYSRFDPLNPIDTSLEPSSRWYYFRITGVKGKQLFINIRNSEVVRPFYSYDNTHFTRFDLSENVNKGAINKIFTRDTVYISYFIPYTCTHLATKLSDWSKNKFVKEEQIGKSQQGRDIWMMTITDWSVNDQFKKKVWIHGRTHPSETPSSWHLEFFVDKLLDGSKHSNAILANTIFYIVPFNNPDGVYGGFSRSTSTGVNIEINWDKPDSLTMPEVLVLKNKISELTKDRSFDLLLNMHSQIANNITYWVHTAESTSDEMFRKQLLLSHLTINNNPYFCSTDLSFSNLAPKYAEGWMWNKAGNNCVAITFETPYTFYKNQGNDQWVSLDNLKDLASNSLIAVSDFLEISSPTRVLADIKVKNNKKWEKIEDNSVIYFGNDCMTTNLNLKGLKVKANVNFLEPGVYNIFSWSPGISSKNSVEGTNCWKEIGTVFVTQKGKYSWKGYSEQINGIADKILFVK